MDESEDDLYDPVDVVPVTQPSDPRRPPADASISDSNDAEEEEEEVEEEEEEPAKKKTKGGAKVGTALSTFFFRNDKN